MLFVLPNFSDDLYRFVWDGRLINGGLHPFAHVPEYYMQPGSPDVPGITSSLFYQLNSPNYHTIYPPVAQFLFSFSASIFPASVHGSGIIMRIFIIMAEVGSIWLMTRILFHYKMPVRYVTLYALNPLVILELTGNLHFEAFMIFFLLAAIYFLLIKYRNLSALAMAFAICSKLIPLIFLPLFIKRMTWRRLLQYYGLIVLFSAILFAPLIDIQLIKGMQSSMSLYFQHFEFNASIYYLLRQIGYLTHGYNLIEVLGKFLALMTFVVIMTFSVLNRADRNTLPQSMFWVLTIYFMFTTTLHPWYITTLIALSVFTPYRFPLVWSLLIFFTYVGYSSSGYQENLWVVMIEYIIVFAYMIYEIFINRKDKLRVSYVAS